MDTTVTVDVKNVLAWFKSHQRHIEVMARVSVFEATSTGQRIAASLAPVETGEYRDSIRSEYSNAGGIYLGEFGTDDDKGYWLELGTYSGKGEHFHPPVPHFTIAATEAEAVLVSGLERAVMSDV